MKIRCFLQSDGSAALDAFRNFEVSPGSQYPQLNADAVDLPSSAGTCNPNLLIPEGLATATSSPEFLFHHEGGAETVESFRPAGKERLEYIKLVWRQLQRGKTMLRRVVHAVGEVFAVAKSHGRQREIWNGSLFSSMAERPPAPQYLANPACFVDLFFEQGKEVFMSKRDVHTCFDVLEAPPALQPWFGRPPVTLHEVSQVAGIPTTELLLYVADCSSERVCKHDLLYPASTVWPMGFSWSSCVAQAATVACCLQAGVEKDAFMTMDLPPPNGPEACGVATDDSLFILTVRWASDGLTCLTPSWPSMACQRMKRRMCPYRRP